MGNVQIEYTKTDVYWVHCQLCGTDGPRTEDRDGVGRQQVAHMAWHQHLEAIRERADTADEAEPERCPECHMPLTMHHDPGCSRPCGRCAAREAERVLQGRPDSAESSVRKVREWLNLMADRGPDSLLLARELCLLLGWDAPVPGSPVCSRCGATGLIHAIHY